MSEVVRIFEGEGNRMSLLLDTSTTHTPRALIELGGDVDAGTPPVVRRRDMRLVVAGSRLWRVLDPRGRVIGHVQAVASDGDVRYRARRFHTPSRAFRDLGEFWSADDAVECLAFAR